MEEEGAARRPPPTAQTTKAQPAHALVVVCFFLLSRCGRSFFRAAQVAAKKREHEYAAQLSFWVLALSSEVKTVPLSPTGVPPRHTHTDTPHI